MKLNNKKNLVFLLVGIIVVIIVVLILIFGNKDKNNDASNFSNEYKNVPINNKFKYINAKEAIDILQNESGIIFMGYKECVWCQDYAKYLNEAIIDSDVEEIYYLDIYKDRKKKSKEYEKIVKIISDRLPYDEEGNHQILVPSTVFVSSGIVINYDDETSYVNSSMNDKKAYWTDNNIKSFKEKINNYSKNIEVDSVCKENSGC